MSQVLGAGVLISGGVSRTDEGLPAWADRAVPWMASVMLHVGAGLLVLFLTWFVVRALIVTREGIGDSPIPTNFTDVDTPGGVPNPGELNKDTDAAQDRLKDITNNSGWSQNDSTSNASSFLKGGSGDQAAEAIFRGNDQGLGGGQVEAGGGGPMNPYGTPGGGMGAGPTSNFYGAGGSAVKIVYIIDHSGSLLDNFDYLRTELNRSVKSLLPVQQFAVVAFSEDAQVLGPPTLQRATTAAKNDLGKRLDDLKAGGQNDDTLVPFQSAFEKAFAMKPQLIYFLTDGAFDPKLADVIKRLNADHKVKVNTLAFVQEEPQYKQQLSDLAKQNGGVYKFVSEKDLGK